MALYIRAKHKLLVLSNMYLLLHTTELVHWLLVHWLSGK